MRKVNTPKHRWQSPQRAAKLALSALPSQPSARLRRLPRGSQRLPESSQKAPKGSQRLPEGFQKAPKRLPESSQKALKRFPEAPRGSQKLPKGTQKASRRLPEGFQKAPRSCQNVPEGSQRLPEGFQKAPKRLPESSQKALKRFPEAPRGSQKLPKGPQKAPRRLPESSQKLPEAPRRFPEAPRRLSADSKPALGAPPRPTRRTEGPLARVVFARCVRFYTQASLASWYSKQTPKMQASWHANTEVGIYGLALNPKKWKIGWLASYLERGGKRGISPRSKGPTTMKRADTIPWYAATLTPFRCVVAPSMHSIFCCHAAETP